MRPDVYPRTLENIKAVLLYYFPKASHSEIDINSEWSCYICWDT